MGFITKRIIMVLACFALFSLFGCRTNISENESSEFGSIIIPVSSSRSIDVNQITSAKVIVSGTGIESGSEPCAAVSVSGGANSENVIIDKIPAGKNRIISVYAYDEDGKLDENQIVLRTVKDIVSGDNGTIYITKSTTALGNVFYYLDEIGYSVSSVTSEQLSSIQNAIDSDSDCLDIDAAKIAQDFKSSGVSGLKSSAEYVKGYTSGVTPAQVVLHVKGYQYVWYWDDGEDGALAEMETDSEKGDGWYTYTFANKSSINLIFRPNGGSDWNGQTGNLTRTSGVWYYEDSSWSGTASSDTENPSISWIKPESGETVKEDVHFIVSASDNEGISRVEFYADDVLICETSGLSSIVFDSYNLTNGTHSVYAKAYDFAENSSVTETVSIDVENAEKQPVAVLDSEKTCTEGVSTSFDGSKSKGSVSSYSWDFGDGSTGSGAQVKHTYASKGDYTAVLTVTSAGGLTDSASMTVTVLEKGAFVHRDFREESIYFMMTDRFSDGDESNNNIWGDEYLPNGKSDLYTYSSDKTDVLSYYHGGDFQGIIDNLDYIKDMGFTAIWITPVLKQCEGRYYYGDYQASAFHGYWTMDFDQIDPHLHSSGVDSDGWDDYKALIDACHAKGIRVMQDIVCNHGHLETPQSPTKWISYKDSVIMDGRTWTKGTVAGTDGDPYYNADDVMQGFFTYHNKGAQCSTLIDFNEQGNDGSDARQHLINVYKKFIDAGVDAFRIDTVAYMTADWWGEFADTMYNYAKTKGNDYFYMVGEAWGGRGPSITFHSKDTTNSFHQLDMTASCMDYPGEMRGAFEEGGDFTRFTNLCANDVNQGLTDEDSTWSGMFVDNHDCARADGWLNETGYKNALTYVYLFRGVPIVYYGTEALYHWSGAVASTSKDDVVARWMLGEVGMKYCTDNKPAMYKHIITLNKVYHECECIQKGVQATVSIGGDKAAFTRTYDDKTAYVLQNKGSSSITQSFDVTSGTYKLYLYDGSTLSESTGTYSGSTSVTSPANGFALLEPVTE